MAHQGTLVRVGVRERVRSAASCLDELIEALPLPALRIDRNGRTRVANRLACELLGIASSDLPRASVRALVRVLGRECATELLAAFFRVVEFGSSETIDTSLRSKRGEIRDVRILLSKLNGAEARGDVVATIEDLTQARCSTSALDRLAVTDQVTGLPNLHGFRDSLGRELSTRAADRAPLSVVAVQLHGLNRISNLLGRSVREMLVRSVAGHLERTLQFGNVVAKVGDSLWMLLGNESDIAVSTWVGDTLARFQQPFEVGSQALFVDATIGMARFPDDGQDADSLIRHVDLALHRAEERGPGAIQQYDPDMSAQISRNLGLEADLRSALSNDQLRLRYQPIVDLPHGRVLGVEALLRWEHPQFGCLPPNDFLHLVEVVGMRTAVTDWVLLTACQEIQELRRVTKRRDLTVAVNVSAPDFAQPNFPGRVFSMLAKSGLPARCLQLEITEQVAIENRAQALDIMTKLVRLGVQIVIDDFGTGYSSLSYLADFPISVLKIDRSFVSRYAASMTHAAVARSVIHVAKSLDVVALAEGIETHEQLDFMLEHGCSQAQGYLFSPPVQLEELHALVSRD